ncbi:FHA domain-containing protein [Solirubrobacter sp. CPCC 204708]|uniref:FHA domain-containing protein n=1 Tax=Solirubrobacter deserti TaxID=2282478 RepID=A0ABT4RUJ8_9ACTN|nr:FHA domain-containing protein [Solirubrobacter deserti]MBE2318338.1 FHA domain-containing protein [Solirubrobacter deserti]MDA0141936.1 FHA domain-containing protein [Solirubrobacter deserti]
MPGEPVRPDGAAELARIAQVAGGQPYVAWRDADGVLRIHALTPRAPATVGRVDGTVSFPAHRKVSREHAEITLRTYGDPPAVCVYLLDTASKHGTEHRSVRLRQGVAVETGSWMLAPRMPARPAQLDAGEHDVRLAGERFLLVGGVPLDEGRTSDRDELPQPTARQREVLVELCRPFFAAPGELVATPSNAQIAARLQPPIGPERVSDLLSDLYRLYDLRGTKEQNRLQLVALAQRHLLDAGDYG